MTTELHVDGVAEALRIPCRSLLGVLTPPPARNAPEIDARLAQTVSDCREFVANAERVLVLVNDYTRPTPNALLLDALESTLATRETTYLVALGTHRPPRDVEFRQIFGSGFYDRNRDQIRCHDSMNEAGLYFVGRTRRDTEVWYNRQLHRADRVVTINSIEPHYFAGFTGGRKGFLPGIAGADTIAKNHSMVTDPHSLPFALTGNPVHEDMVEAARMVTAPVFSVQLVQDRDHRLMSIHSGDLFESFQRACADARDLFAVQVSQRADIILSVLRAPYDINFYQSQRAVEFARPALKSPSVQITVSACHDGIGNDGFIRCFDGCSSAADVLTRADHSAFGWHKSARLAQIMAATRLYTVMGVPDDAVRSAFMTPFADIQTALDSAFDLLGDDATIYVIPDAGSVVPVVTD